MEKYARKDSKTGRGMNVGFCFADGEAYFEDEVDALEYAQECGYGNLDESYDDEFHYYTEWSDEDYYYTEDGTYVESGSVLETLLELQEQAKELIDLGDSREKAEGFGMMRIIEEIKSKVVIDDPN